MDNIIITADELRADPAVVSAILQYDGAPVHFRHTRTDDALILGDYFLGLTDETKRRYGPHRFDRETAQMLCTSTDPAQTLRMIATIGEGNAEQVIGYIILILGIREDDAKRYEQLGIPLNADTDCTLAPSVADAHQSRGLGSICMKHLISVARRVGRKRMVLWGGTQATNYRAVHFYEKHGFRTVGFFEEPPGFNNHDMIMEL
jgi:GNAT superfamily N-acetyltransferase